MKSAKFSGFWTPPPSAFHATYQYCLSAKSGNSLTPVCGRHLSMAPKWMQPTDQNTKFNRPINTFSRSTFQQHIHYRSNDSVLSHLAQTTTELVTSLPNKARVSCKFYVALPEIFYWQRRRLRRRPQLNLFAKCQALHSTDMLCQDYYDGLGRPCLQLSWREVGGFLKKDTLMSRSVRNLI